MERKVGRHYFVLPTSFYSLSGKTKTKAPAAVFRHKTKIYRYDEIFQK